MIIETEDVMSRYNLSRSTLDRKRDQIIQNKGIIQGKGGSSPNLYKTSVLDKMAKRGELGQRALKAILEK